MPKLFDYINSINSKSGDLWKEGEDHSDYTPYVVNKAFSYYQDTIFYMEVLDQFLKNLTPEQHYKFLYYELPKGKRFSKWHKKIVDETAEVVKKELAEFYEVNLERAAEIAHVLTDDQLEEILKKIRTGGLVK